ncbi:MAG: hypothetical protein ACRYF0_06525 [Janthinobacterium lividum]
MKPLGATFSLRPTLAAAVLLAVLAVAYRVAVRQTGPVAGAALPTRLVISARPATPATVTDMAAPPAPECPPQVAVFTGGRPAARRPVVVRRYVGTVGGQAATAVLQWQTPDSATGSFYLYRGGPAYTLSFDRARPGPVRLEVTDEQGSNSQLPRGHWQLRTSTLASPTLTGTWHGAGRAQPLLLRESYADALRYAFKERYLLSAWRVPEDCSYVPTVRHTLLTLLSPRTAPPALRAPLAGSAAALRRRLREDVTDGDASASYRDEVRLNEFGLFSYQTSFYQRSYGGTPDVGSESWLFDLRTGQELDIASQLKPGYERPLRRRLTRHLLRDPALAAARAEGLGLEPWYADGANLASLLLDLPGDNEALTLTGAGLEAAYTPPPFNQQLFILVPYRELRPLVRPGTPLARMLRARGLW